MGKILMNSNQSELVNFKVQQTLWLLANSPEDQQRLRDELTPVFAEDPRPDYRTLKDLQWLDCVM